MGASASRQRPCFLYGFMCVALLVSVFFSAAHAASAQPKIESFRLKNGMEVILIPNHRVPAVTHMMWYRVGAADDPTGKSGLAHFSEHMMFRGTGSKEQGPGDFSRIITQHGGNHNANTSKDRTMYYVNIASEYLPLVMRLEADRMMHTAPEEKDAVRERDVIIEERRSVVDNNPAALMNEQMTAAMFLNHPYHVPTIGWLSEMKTLTQQDVQDFHKHYYRPGNAFLVVAGDITRDKLEPMAEQYYGSLEAGVPATRTWREEPPHHAAQRLVMHDKNVKQPTWSRYYLAPGMMKGDTKQALPLYVLTSILGGGEINRLKEALVMRDKIATSAEADYDGMQIGPGILSVYAVPAKDVTLGKLEDAVNAEIVRLGKEGVTSAELARAKTQLKSEAIYARDGLQGMANIVGSLHAIGLPVDYINTWEDLIEQVTAAQVQEAAQQVFVETNSVTGELLPEEKHHAK